MRLVVLLLLLLAFSACLDPYIPISGQSAVLRDTVYLPGDVYLFTRIRVKCPGEEVVRYLSPLVFRVV